MSEHSHILTVDDSAGTATSLVNALHSQFWDTEGVCSGVEALERVKQERFDCIVMNAEIHGGNGAELYWDIRNAQPDLPMLLTTAYTPEKSELAQTSNNEGLAASEMDFFLSFFSAVHEDHSVVIVDDDVRFSEVLEEVLGLRGYATRRISNPFFIMERLNPEAQVVLLDASLCGKSGGDVLREIRKQYPCTMMILLAECCEQTVPVIQAAVKIGAHTFIRSSCEFGGHFWQQNEGKHNSSR